MKVVAATDLANTVVETIDFLEEALIDIPECKDRDDMVSSHCINLVKLIGNLDFDMADATAAMKIVREKKDFLGSSNVDRLRTAICRSSETAVKPKPTNQTAQMDYQEHNFIEFYVTEAMWSIMQSDR